MAKVNIKGFVELESLLKELPDSMTKRFIRSGLNKTGKEMTQAIKGNARKGIPAKIGRDLSKAVTKKNARIKGNVGITIGLNKGWKKRAKNAWQAYFYENGAFPRVTKKGASRGRIFPRRWFFRGYVSKRDATLEKGAVEIWNATANGIKRKLRR